MMNVALKKEKKKHTQSASPNWLHDSQMPLIWENLMYTKNRSRRRHLFMLVFDGSTIFQFNDLYSLGH